MSIPDFQSLMLPILRRLAERQWSTSELVEAMAAEHSLTDEERRALLPSGRQTTIANCTHWALTHLGKANFIARVSRGGYEAMKRGRGILAALPDRITLAYLNRFPEFVAFRTAVRVAGGADVGPGAATSPELLAAQGSTPEERLEAADRDPWTELDHGKDSVHEFAKEPPRRFVLEAMHDPATGTLIAQRSYGMITGQGNVPFRPALQLCRKG